jgi:hypothetical protein
MSQPPSGQEVLSSVHHHRLYISFLEVLSAGGVAA